MGNDQKIPAVIQDIADIALNMAVAVVFGREQVARPRIMAFFQKRMLALVGKGQQPDGTRTE